MNWNGSGRKRSWHNLRHRPLICLRKTLETLGQDSWCLTRDPNQADSIHKSEASLPGLVLNPLTTEFILWAECGMLVCWGGWYIQWPLGIKGLIEKGRNWAAGPNWWFMRQWPPLYVRGETEVPTCAASTSTFVLVTNYGNAVSRGASPMGHAGQLPLRPN
jgi:hypothetical protein